MICPTGRAEYFCADGWTRRANHFEPLTKSGSHTDLWPGITLRQRSNLSGREPTFVGEAARRTKGVSAAFIKELMRRTAQASIGRDGGVTIRTADLDEALDDMLFASGKLNVRLLGGAQEARGAMIDR